MKHRISKLSFIGSIGIALALLFIVVSCGKKGGAGKPANVDYYTCTMHPSVKSQDPKAKCPICGMDLVPVKGKAAGSDGTNSLVSSHQPGAMGTNAMEETSEFVVPVERQQMIGVTYATVTKKPVKH